MSSLLRRRLESVSRLLLAGRDVPVVVDADHALALELEHQRLGLLHVGRHVVVVVDLGLGLCKEGQLGLRFRLLLLSGLLVGLDLRHGASTLAADLEHVGAHALGHWNTGKG